MLHEATFLATCNATNVALQVARKKFTCNTPFCNCSCCVASCKKSRTTLYFSQRCETGCLRVTSPLQLATQFCQNGPIRTHLSEDVGDLARPPSCLLLYALQVAKKLANVWQLQLERFFIRHRCVASCKKNCLVLHGLYSVVMRVNEILSLFSFCDVCSADCRSIYWARWKPALYNRSEAGETCLSKKSHISSDFKEKSESSLKRRRSLRNWKYGLEFLTCDGCEDEFNK